MIHRLALVAVAICVAGANVGLAQVVRMPGGPPPQVALAQVFPGQINGKDGGVLALTESRLVPEQRTELVVVDGVQSERVYTVSVPVMIKKQIFLGGEAARFFDAQGKPVDPRTLTMQLRDETPIVVFHGKADPFYLQVLDRKTLVLELREN